MISTTTRFFAILVILGAVVGASGCVVAPVVPPLGLVFNNVSAPLDIDFEKSSVGSTTGTSDCYSVLGIAAWGDASATKAARNGKLKTIDGADYTYLSVLGIFTRYQTVVYGR